MPLVSAVLVMSGSQAKGSAGSGAPDTQVYRSGAPVTPRLKPPPTCGLMPVNPGGRFTTNPATALVTAPKLLVIITT